MVSVIKYEIKRFREIEANSKVIDSLVLHADSVLKLPNVSRQRDTLYLDGPLYYDTTKGLLIQMDGVDVFYGTAGIQFDSAKYYYKRYLKLKNKGVPDSNNKYKILLQKYISK